eukprot:COSAG03_NODE_4496_length_1531_cov_8.043994_3_plen_68_part_00
MAHSNHIQFSLSLSAYLSQSVSLCGPKALWLAAAGGLEMLGINTFLCIWVAGLLFFGVNILCTYPAE